MRLFKKKQDAAEPMVDEEQANREQIVEDESNEGNEGDEDGLAEPADPTGDP